MQARLYIKIARTKRGYRATVSTARPSRTPLEDNTWRKRPLPTVFFGVDFKIPDEAFDVATKVIAEVTIPVSNLEIAADVVQLDPAPQPTGDRQP